MKNVRKGLGKGMGCGYKNIAPMDAHIHSLSARGQKTSSDTKVMKFLVVKDDYKTINKFLGFKNKNILKAKGMKSPEQAETDEQLDMIAQQYYGTTFDNLSKYKKADVKDLFREQVFKLSASSKDIRNLEPLLYEAVKSVDNVDAKLNENDKDYEEITENVHSAREKLKKAEEVAYLKEHELGDDESRVELEQELLNLGYSEDEVQEEIEAIERGENEDLYAKGKTGKLNAKEDLYGGFKHQRKGHYTGEWLKIPNFRGSGKARNVKIGKITGWHGTGEPVYELTNDIGEHLGELSNNFIKQMVNKNV